MWTKVRREHSKKLEPEPMGAKPKTETKKEPDKPKDPSKPPYPYSMTDSEAREYRWRWVEAGLRTAASMDQEELEDGVRYVIEILKSNGIEDPAAFVAQVASQERQARRNYRAIIYGRK